MHTLTRVDSFDMDPRLAHEVNVIGTLNLLAGCAGAGSPVTRFVLKSSSHVYGSSPDLPSVVREDHRLDTNSHHQFVRDIVEVESYVNDFAARNAGIDILVLRFGNSLNPDEPQQFYHLAVQAFAHLGDLRNAQAAEPAACSPNWPSSRVSRRCRR